MFDSHPADKFAGALIFATAKRELARRRVRSNWLSEDLFSEGGYNMLLYLFVKRLEGQICYVKDVVSNSNVPEATAMRWLSVLENRCLIERGRDLSDSRKRYVDLSVEGCSAVKNLLCDMIEGEKAIATVAPKAMALDVLIFCLGYTFVGILVAQPLLPLFYA